MATFRALAPVGCAVSLAPTDFNGNLLEGYRHFYTDSGTSALALALNVVKKTARKHQRKVAIPGYACPDLISAIVFNDLEPVLIDLRPNHCQMDLAALEAELDEDFLAIIAVNFCGVREDIEALSSIEALSRFDIQLIEDSAQCCAGDLPAHNAPDLIIFSFGRGKPASVLGGGALLVREGSVSDRIKPLPVLCSSLLQKLKAWLKFRLFNILIWPRFYGLLIRLPGLNIGSTYYKKLESIRGISDISFALLSANIDQYLLQPRTVEERYKKNLPTGLNSLGSSESVCRLLRYPVLMPTIECREKAFSALNNYGLGATKLYQKPLNQMDDVKQYLSAKELAKPLENARIFSERLLTLPVHSSVSERDIEKTIRALKNFDVSQTAS